MPNLHLTYRRNQRGFSWSRGLLADQEEPTREQIRAAVATLPPNSGPLYLTGGEPTLRPDLFEILVDLTTRFPDQELVVVSDGRMYRDVRYCDSFSSVRTPRLTIEIVLASTRAGVHDDVVDAENSFDRAKQGIRHLLARGRRTRIRVAVGRHNFAHLHEMAASIPDRFAGIESVVWDTGMFARSALELLPDEASGYLESAINLLRGRGIPSRLSRTPACSMSEKYRGDVDMGILGTYAAECEPCLLRDKCPGITESLAANPAFRVHPILPVTAAATAAAYEPYLFALLDAYVPPAARSANFVLDAMCGQRLRNLSGLRRFFGTALSVSGADVALKPQPAPEGTSVYQADFLLPLDPSVHFDFVAFFKPPGNSSVVPMEQAVTNLVAALSPGGHLMVVLAEHTDVEFMTGVLQKLALDTLVSEANRLRSGVEPEHKWVIVCRKRS